VFGYLRKWRKGKILIDVADAPVREGLKKTTGQNWSEIYPDAVEDIPIDMPTPKGMMAKLTTYVDVDHACEKVTRRSISGVLMLINNTPL